VWGRKRGGKQKKICIVLLSGKEFLVLESSIDEENLWNPIIELARNSPKYLTNTFPF
jgi:hypothetical protein